MERQAMMVAVKGKMGEGEGVGEGVKGRRKWVRQTRKKKEVGKGGGERVGVERMGKWRELAASGSEVVDM